MIRVKLFQRAGILELEDAINRWLEKEEYSLILDIKFVHEPKFDDDDEWYTAMIIYRDRQERI